MRTQLLSHNKVAYQKVVKALETADRTCVVHPTGTGKSYLIAAVSESYRNVLILGPNTFVLDQVHSVLAWRDRKKDAGTVEYMTYTLLLYTESPKSDYDLICLDEFHRAGAPEWGDAVDRLLELNPQAKVLGTTATPIRFLDDNRDMADELFEGNIASYMTLKDAWDMNILATPRFVTGLFEFDRVTADMEERIRKSRRIDDKEKKRRLTRVNNLRLDWERSQGMPQIIRKHIDEGAKRIIVFCGNVEHLKTMEQTVREWFRRAGRKVAEVYNVHAYMPDKDLKAAMDGFEDDDFGEGGVKLMLSVNLLNEGVHIPRVNAVILLRTTSSKIIYLQQIGRCLTAANTDKPVILDMVDNITTTNLVHDIREGFDWYEHQQLKDEEEPREHEPKDFVVYDYTLGIRQAIEKLVPEEKSYMSVEDRVSVVKSFTDKNGKLPGKGDIEEYRHWRYLCIVVPKNEEVIELRKKYGRMPNDDDDLIWLRSFTKEKGRLPNKRKDGEDGKRFDNLIHRQRNSPNKKIQAILDDYQTRGVDKVKREIKAFIHAEGRFPSAAKNAPKEEFRLRISFLRHKRILMQDPEIAASYDMSKNCNVFAHKGDEKYADWLEEVKAFEEKEGRLPSKRDGDIYKHWDSLYSNRSEWVKDLKEKYKGRRNYGPRVNLEARLDEIEAFAMAKHRLPYNSRSSETHLARHWQNIKRLYPEHPRVIALKERFPIQNRR